MDYSHKNELYKRFDFIQKSKETDIYRNLKALQASYHVFYGNYIVLTKYLEPLQDPKESLKKYNFYERKNQEDLIDETSRLFHNFIAATESLFDHTDKIIEKLYSQFRNEYDEKKEKYIKSQSISKFVKDLRQYTLHYTLPLKELQIGFSIDRDIDFSMKINIEHLKKSSKWRKKFNHYLKGRESLSVLNLVNDYFVLIQNFYDWLTTKLISQVTE
ncbi:MAG: hypothetical protein HEP80_10020 [Dolichospermum sp. UKL201]|uniref:hypothetical protein n=1 Tax=Anabaena sp. AL09 TaxID=1710891 RepID=UPI001AF975AF|nr:hypothetical protein [Anabaena sp. AL09]QSV54162.1 MAG: hypothetical protein HEP80_10020 [Dolichospermum sp. UKL201]